MLWRRKKGIDPPSFNRTFMELKLVYAAMRILYKITKYRVGRGGFNRPHNVVNGSLRSLRCYVLLGKRSFSIDCAGFWDKIILFAV